MRLSFSLVVFVWLFTSGVATAQYDSSFYVSYADSLACRFYFSQKYTAFRFNDTQEDIVLRYLPNTTLNIGVGASYRSLSLNLAYGFGFLNPDRGTGETKYLDLQAHIYGRRVMLDFLGQFYDGFYLEDDDMRDSQGNYYSRPDIKVRVYGLSGQYILNKERFSFRAGFLQNEWQKKSAGTILLGWQVVLGNGSADSTIVPSVMQNGAAPAGPQRLSFFETGPGVGYAYTLVIKEHFFIMASGSVAFTFDYNKIETDSGTESSNTFFPNFSFKAFAGYNSEKNAISLTFTNETVNLVTGETDQRFSLNTGNLRLNFVRRIAVKSKLLKERNKRKRD